MIEEIDKKGRIISLNVKEIEQYEVNNDNIGEIRISGQDKTKEYKIIFELSKEAMIGLGIHCIRYMDCFESIDGVGLDLHVDPLGRPSPNQQMGFFLAPGSEGIVFMGNDYGDLNENGIDRINKNKQIQRKNGQHKANYLIELEWDDECYESYNLGLLNIANIKCFENGVELPSYGDVLFSLSKNAYLGFGTELLRLAHNFKEGEQYTIKPMNDIEQDCQMGFFLTKTSAELEIVCKSFPSVFHYDKDY
jgi:hypothetical protein